MIEKFRRKTVYQIRLRQTIPPRSGDNVDPIICPGDLTVNGVRGVGIVAAIDGQQAALPDIRRAVERPQSHLKRLHDLATADDGGPFLVLERTGSHRINLRAKRLVLPETRHRGVFRPKQCVLVDPQQGPDDQPAEIAAGVNAGASIVGGP